MPLFRPRFRTRQSMNIARNVERRPQLARIQHHVSGYTHVRPYKKEIRYPLIRGYTFHSQHSKAELKIVQSKIEKKKGDSESTAGLHKMNPKPGILESAQKIGTNWTVNWIRGERENYIVLLRRAVDFFFLLFFCLWLVADLYISCALFLVLGRRTFGDG